MTSAGGKRFVSLAQCLRFTSVLARPSVVSSDGSHQNVSQAVAYDLLEALGHFYVDLLLR